MSLLHIEKRKTDRKKGKRKRKVKSEGEREKERERERESGNRRVLSVGNFSCRAVDTPPTPVCRMSRLSQN